MKSVKKPKTPDDYLAGIPEPAHSTLQHIREVIKSAVPKETTEVISYGIPMFKYKGGLVAFAAFSKHCSFFPMSRSVIAAFQDQLQEFETSRGTIRFPLDKPLPPALLKKLVKARIAENERRGPGGAGCGPEPARAGKRKAGASASLRKSSAN